MQIKEGAVVQFRPHSKHAGIIGIVSMDEKSEDPDAICVEVPYAYKGSNTPRPVTYRGHMRDVVAIGMSRWWHGEENLNHTPAFSWNDIDFFPDRMASGYDRTVYTADTIPELSVSTNLMAMEWSAEIRIEGIHLKTTQKSWEFALRKLYELTKRFDDRIATFNRAVDEYDQKDS